MTARTTILRYAAVAAAFLVAGALGRFAIRHVESRVQILAFCGLALAVEVASRRFGDRPSTLRFALNAGAATVAIVAVKWSIEGTPF